MKLRVLKGDAPLEGLLLDLKNTGDMEYVCTETGYKFFDTWDEIYAIEKSKESRFFNLHIFTDSINKKKLHWISELEKVNE